MPSVKTNLMSLFVPPTACHYVTGTWTDAPGAVANTIAKAKAAANDTSIVTVPIPVLQNARALKQGSQLKSIDVWFETLDLANDAVSALIHRAVLPLQGAAFAAPASLAFSYDADHNDAAERITIDQHKITLTLTDSLWLDDDDVILVQLTFDAGATSLITFFGARANFTLRL